MKKFVWLMTFLTAVVVQATTSNLAFALGSTVPWFVAGMVFSPIWWGITRKGRATPWQWFDWLNAGAYIMLGLLILNVFVKGWIHTQVGQVEDDNPNHPNQTTAAHWYLVMTEKSELYSADAFYRLETTLIQNTVDHVAVWVRTDFHRPKGFKYSRHPRQNGGKLIRGDAYVWTKEQYVVDCKSQKVNITDSSYQLYGENIEWVSNDTRTVTIAPDSIFEIVYKIVCDDQKARSNAEIQRLVKSIESGVLSDSKNQL